MEAFFTARNRWPAGWTRLHVYLCPDLSTDRALADLIARTQTVLTGIPWLALVPVDWLHLTVQQISQPQAAQITPAQRQQLLDALGAHLAPVAPFQLTVGSVLVGASGVVADVDGDQPGQPLHDLHARTRTAISSVLGPAAIDRNAMPPHLGLGYGLGPGSSGHLQSALRRAVRPPHATMTVDRVHLVDVTQGTTGYTWTTVGQVPLTAGR